MPDILFLPYAPGSTLESPPVEDVLFLRDEMANMAWAMEREIESAGGKVLNRFETTQEETEGRKIIKRIKIIKLSKLHLLLIGLQQASQNTGYHLYRKKSNEISIPYNWFVGRN